MKKGIFRYGWRIGLGYLWWRFGPSGIVHRWALYEEDEEWSNHLEALLCFEQFEERTERCVLKIGGVALWCSNHPYASFSKYEDMMEPHTMSDKLLPSRFVVYLAERKCREQGINLRG